MALLDQKLWGGKKLLKSVFGYKNKNQIKKVPAAIKLGGRGGRVRPLRKGIFLRLPLPDDIQFFSN